jgi:crossover junction endodeoxyribonuclease RuvC
VLGFDPGLGDTGYGVLTLNGRELRATEYGSLRTSLRQPLPERLAELSQKVRVLLARLQPGVVGVERLAVGRNVATVLPVAHARGVLLAQCAVAGIPVIEVTPSQVKAAVTGYGLAEKGQVARLLRVQLKISKPIQPNDAADALAVALTIAHRVAC